MWTYQQSTGQLRHEGELASIGYAGMPPNGKNNPAAQNIHDVGPIPQGFYTPQAPINHPQLGPYAIRLVQDATNEMFGRDGFFMHSDSMAHPGRASEGCIVIALSARQQFWASGDHRLQVIA